MVVRELEFPVEEPEFGHLLEITPTLERVELRDPDGVPIKSKRAVTGGLPQVEYAARESGKEWSKCRCWRWRCGESGDREMVGLCRLELQTSTVSR